MADLFSAFLNKPGAETYLALRSAIMDMPEYDMYSNGLRTLSDMVQAKDFESVPEFTPQLMPNYLLSAPVHLLLSQAAEGRGDNDKAEMEATMARACAFALKSTGDGSKDAPYFPMQTSDEYFVCDMLGKSPTGQRLINDGGRTYDVISCDDGSEVWFDITEGFAAMQKRMH